MEDPAVIDAYLGAHHDTDLGDIDGPNPVEEAEKAAAARHADDHAGHAGTEHKHGKDEA